MTEAHAKMMGLPASVPVVECILVRVKKVCYTADWYLAIALLHVWR